LCNREESRSSLAAEKAGRAVYPLEDLLDQVDKG
jgi:hypothetical protein